MVWAANWLHHKTAGTNTAVSADAFSRVLPSGFGTQHLHLRVRTAPHPTRSVQALRVLAQRFRAFPLANTLKRTKYLPQPHCTRYFATTKRLCKFTYIKPPLKLGVLRWAVRPICSSLAKRTRPCTPPRTGPLGARKTYGANYTEKRRVWQGWGFTRSNICQV